MLRFAGEGVCLTVTYVTTRYTELHCSCYVRLYLCMMMTHKSNIHSLRLAPVIMLGLIGKLTVDREYGCNGSMV